MAAERKIEIPIWTWRRLVAELQKRGFGRRESGAFLLGNKSSGDRRVVAFLCYDDLDPEALSSGYVTLHGRGVSALWDICSKTGMCVLADVHTHPGASVRQSSIDREHPMIPVQGHVALILPRYGLTSKWSLAGAGLYVFQGKAKWASFSCDHPATPVRLSLW